MVRSSCGPPLNAVRPGIGGPKQGSSAPAAARSSEIAQGCGASLPPRDQLKLVPWGRILALDTLCSFSVLTNLVTRERVQLSGEYELVVDDEGEEALLIGGGGDDGSIREVPPLFSQHLYESTTSERWILDMSNSGEAWTCLDALESKFKTAECKVDIGGGAAEGSFETFVFRRARDLGLYTFWSMASVYSFLKHDAFKGFCSRWVSRSRATWVKSWAGFIGSSASEHFVCAADDRGDRSKIDGQPWPTRCLPQSSVSTFGLLGNVLRWYCLPANHGGMSHLRQRDACASLMKALISLALPASGETSFAFEVCGAWEARYPRPAPEVDQATIVNLKLQGRRLDLSALEAASAAASSRTAAPRKLWAALRDSMGDALIVDVQAVFGPSTMTQPTEDGSGACVRGA